MMTSYSSRRGHQVQYDDGASPNPNPSPKPNPNPHPYPHPLPNPNQVQYDDGEIKTHWLDNSAEVQWKLDG